MEKWQPHHGRRGRGRTRGNHPSSYSSRSNDSRPPTTPNHAISTSKHENNNPESLPNLIGTCPFMCPVDERIQRERLRDLAVFERLDGNPTKSSPSLAVKKFSRTISTKDTRVTDLRPVNVLEHTLNHLLTIFGSKTHPFEIVHEFVFDRTRSIRQDLTMQNVTPGTQSIRIFERIVEFHIVSEYKLQKAADSDVSPMHHLNFEQLNKALASLYHLYNENRKSNPGFPNPNEPGFYSFYVLLHLGSDNQPTGESLSLWFSTLPNSVVKSKEMAFSRRLLRYFRFGDYRRFLRTIEAEASCLQYYVLEPYVSEIRATGLCCLNYGGYKLNPYPLSDLSNQLLMEECDVESFCKDCGLDTFTSDSGVKFMPTKQTSFRYPKGARKYYPVVSKRLKPFYNETSYGI